jgi:hypothetical protein
VSIWTESQRWLFVQSELPSRVAPCTGGVVPRRREREGDRRLRQPDLSGRRGATPRPSGAEVESAPGVLERPRVARAPGGRGQIERYRILPLRSARCLRTSRTPTCGSRKLAMIRRPPRCASAPPGAPRPGRWGSPPNPCSGGNFWRRGGGSFRREGGSFRPRRPGPAPAAAPLTRARQGQRVRTPTRGRESRVRDRTDRPQKPEALVSKT